MSSKPCKFYIGDSDTALDYNQMREYLFKNPDFFEQGINPQISKTQIDEKATETGERTEVRKPDQETAKAGQERGVSQGDSGQRGAQEVRQGEVPEVGGKGEEVTDQQIDQAAQKAGIKPKNLRDLYNINRDLFGLDRIKSFASAVAMDRMVGAMAKRAGVTKEQMYGRLEFRKASEAFVKGLSNRAKVLWQIVGKNAQLAQDVRDNLQVARGMEATEKDAKTIRLATGWERGADGLWRYEILDDLSLDSIEKGLDKEGVYGEDVFVFDFLSKDSQLIKLYPQLQDIKVIINRKNKDSKGSYSAKNKAITLNVKSFSKPFVKGEGMAKLQSTLLHEIQHAIQDIEGFAKGGSPSGLGSVEALVKQAKKERQKLGEKYNELEQEQSDLLKIKNPNKEQQKRFEETIKEQNKLEEDARLLKEVEENPQNVSESKIQELAYKGYKSLAGEVEARNVQTRMGMTPEQRRETLLSETEDVARDEQIVLFQNSDGKARGAVMVSLDGQAVIYALTDPNVSTPLHEMAHVFEHYLTDAERAAVQNWAGTKAWDTQTSEKFARGFEKYLAEGKAPTPALQKIFEKFKQWLTDIYNGITGSEIDIELNEQMRDIYAKMLGSEAATPTTPPAAPKSELEALAEEFGKEVEKTVSFDDQIKEKKKNLKDLFEKSKAARRGIGINPYSRAKAIAQADREFFNGLIDLAKLYVKQTGATLKDFASKLGVDPDNYVVQDAYNAALSGTIPPKYSDAVQKANIRSGKFKTSQATEKLAQGLENQGRRKLAKAIRKQGDYEVSDQSDVSKDIDALITDIGMENAVGLLGEGVLPFDAEVELASRWAGELDPLNVQAAEGRDLTAEETAEYKRRFKIYQENYGTEPAKALSQRQTSNKNIPSMVVEITKEETFTKPQEKKMGTDPTVPGSPINKASQVGKSVPAIRKDFFSKVAALMQGETEGLSVKDFTDKKVREAFKTLLNFGRLAGKDAKESLRELLDRVKNEGLLGVENTREQVREIVKGAINDINGRLKKPMSASEINKTTDAFMDVYEDLAGKRIEQEIEKVFGEAKKRNFSKSANPKIARAILYGALDDADLRNQFAAKFGLPTLTPQNAAKLTQLAQAVANAPSGFQKVVATNALNAYVSMLQSKAKPGLSRYMIYGSDFLSYYLNNILANFNTINRAVFGNISRLFEIVAGRAIRGDFSWAKLVAKKIPSVDVPYVENGVQKTQKVSMKVVRDNFLAAARGNPKLAHLMSGGLPEAEAKIRAASTRRERMLRRAFTVPANRALSVTDALTTRIPEVITYQQVYKELLKDWYKNQGITVSRQQLQDDIDFLLSPEPSAVVSAGQQAMSEIRNGLLWQQLGLPSNYEFPTAESLKGAKAFTSKDAKIYLEYLTRMYEILYSNRAQKLVDLQVMRGLQVDPESEAKQTAIDEYVASVTNEIVFFGTPRGSAGDIARGLTRISNSMPVLKYTSFFPLFINATLNGAGLAVKMTPGLNAVQLLKYKATGKRGFGKKEFDYDFLAKTDQAKMAGTVAVTTVLAAGATALFRYLYDDEDEKRKAINEGKATIITPVQFTAEQRTAFKTATGELLKEGFIYINGEPVYNYRDSPFIGFFAAVEYMTNYGTFKRGIDLNPQTDMENPNQIYVEDDPETMSAIGGYMLNTYITLSNISALRELGQTVNDLFNVRSTDKGKKIDEKAVDALKKSSANFARNLVPYSRMQMQIKNFYDSFNGDYKLAGQTFSEKLAVGTMLEDAIVKSAMTDPFGRELPEMLNFVNPLGINVLEVGGGKIVSIFDKAYQNDPYMQMHLSHNFAPRTSSSITIPVNVDEEEVDIGTEEELKSEMAKLSGKKEIKNIKPKISDFEESGYSYNLSLEASEVMSINKLRGEYVKKIFDTGDNKALLKDMKNYDYRKLMTSVYEAAQQRAIIKNHPDLVGMGYKTAYENKLSSIVSKYGLDLPDELYDYE
jgi:hypothetical protein